VEAFQDPLGRSHNFDMVARTPAGLIAIGSFDEGGAATSAGVWTSSDGRAWQRERDNPAFSRAYLTDILALPDGEVFLVGSRDMDGRATGVMLRDRDGTSAFVEVGGPWEDSRIFGIEALGEELVAVGTMTNPHGDWVRAAIWRSLDGLTWHRSSGPAGTTAFQNVAAIRGGLSATSTAGDPIADPASFTSTFWTSPDGAHWTKGDTIASAQIMGTVATSVGVVAVGAVLNEGHFLSATWSSPDGLHWERGLAPIAANSVLMAVTVSSDAFIAVGWTFGDPSVAMVLVSRDGAVWGAVDDLAFADAELGGVTTLDDHVVAVGSTGPSDAAAPLVLRGPKL
jgi:hypothetical protein